MKIFSLGIFLGLASLTAFAQKPAMADLVGDHVIINYKVYDEQTYVSEVRNFTIEIAEAEGEGQADSLLISGFYQKGSPSFKAAYSATTGNITIPAGTKIFGYSDGEGTEARLYIYDEETAEISTRPIIYRYQSDGTWKCSSYTVMETSVVGSTSSASYYDFAQQSRLAPANGTTSNVTYDGEQVKFVETRPSFVTIDGNYITVYNLLQADSYGYGCWMTFYHSPESNEILAAPTLVGEATGDWDYPYRVLTGCEYDEENCRPDTISYAGMAYEGYILGTYETDGTTGTITLPPMAVWPATYDDNYNWDIDLTRFYEVEESVNVTFNVQNATLAAISSPSVAGSGDSKVVRTDYFDLQGHRLAAPSKGSVIVKRTVFSNGTTTSEKVILR